MFTGKALLVLYSRVGPSLACKHSTWLEGLPGKNTPANYEKSVNYGRKSFIVQDPLFGGMETVSEKNSKAKRVTCPRGLQLRVEYNNEKQKLLNFFTVVII
jgi:hypothetical protein